MRDRVFKTGLGVFSKSQERCIPFSLSPLSLSLSLSPSSLSPMILQNVCHLFFFQWRSSEALLSLVSSYCDLSEDYSHPVISAQFFFSFDRSRISVGALRDIEWFIDLFRKRLFNRALQCPLAIVRLSPGWPLFWSDLFGRDFPFLYFLSRSSPAMKFIVILTCVLFAATRC